MIAGDPEELVQRLNLLEKMLIETPLSEGEVVVGPHKCVWIGRPIQPPRVGFLFPGQGSQRLNMARMLVERYPWARKLVEQANDWLRETESDNPVGAASAATLTRLFRPLDRAADTQQIREWSAALAQTEIAQPAICLASLLWTRHLDLLGVRPTVVGGHSLGELTAFHVAGAFDEKTLLCFAAERGRAMAASELDGASSSGTTATHDGKTTPRSIPNGEQAGNMASLACSRETAEALLK